LVYIGRFIEAKFAKRLHIGARTGVKTIFQYCDTGSDGQ